ncbi:MULTISPECIES: AAA family ATPase [Clostridia]|nr:MULTISPECIES: AAA family ATPase [Clostridia]MCU6696232.1 ATP-binding protein [Laedolimicola ammoniilytica]
MIWLQSSQILHDQISVLYLFHTDLLSVALVIIILNFSLFYVFIITLFLVAVNGRKKQIYSKSSFSFSVTSSYTLNMAEESDGTNSYFKLIGIVKEVLDEGTPLVVDELDAHLHPLLTKHLVSLFNSVEFNPNGAQLIFTSHNTNLLDLDVLRRDQIWFAEKDELTAATDLFSLQAFSIRKDTKLEKGYLIGHYGAIPFIKGGL